MDDILDNIDFDIENNRTVFLKESDPFLPVIPSPEIQEGPLEERLRTPPATPIHSPHAFLKEERWLFLPPLQTAFYWFLPCLDLLPVALLFAYVFPGFLVPRCALLFGEYL